MAVSSTTNRIVFAGNGVTTVFSFPDYLISNTDLKALLVDNTTLAITSWALNTDFTLAFVGAQQNGAYPGGANITASVAPATGKTLVLYRDPAPTQGTHWTDNDPMPSSTTELTADRAMLLIQRLKDQLTRVVNVADGFTGTFNLTLPPGISGLLAALPITDSTGTGWEPDTTKWPTVTGITASVAAAAASAAAAAASAGAAAASAANAAGSASNANTSAINAAASASAAAASAVSASNSAAAAALSAATAAAVVGTPVAGETPAGTVDGVNAAFTLAHTPNVLIPFQLFLDGLRETAFTRVGMALTMTTPPTTGQTLLADYNY